MTAEPYTPTGIFSADVAPGTKSYMAAELEALIAKASDMNLADGGRYFYETCHNFTECDHGDCGEYTEGKNDGKLVEFLWNNRNTILAALNQSGSDELIPFTPEWPMGTLVSKKSGSSWTGKVVGFYSTELTPEGYAIESSSETGSVQIYPRKALELLK